MLQELDTRGSAEMVGPSQPPEPQQQPITRETSPPRQHREGKAPVPPKPRKKKKEGPHFDSSSRSDRGQPIPDDQLRDSLRLKADPMVRAAYEALTEGGDKIIEELKRRLEVTEEDLEAEEEWFNRDQLNASLAEARVRRESEEKEMEAEVVETKESGLEESGERKIDEEIVLIKETLTEESASDEEEIELTETEKVRLNIGEILENYEMGATLNDILDTVRVVSERRKQLEREEFEEEGKAQGPELGKEAENEQRIGKEVIVIEA